MLVYGPYPLVITNHRQVTLRSGSASCRDGVTLVNDGWRQYRRSTKNWEETLRFKQPRLEADDELVPIYEVGYVDILMWVGV